MKTFLRTTLFWLVVGITFFIVSGFGYGRFRITPVFDQLYLVKRLPTQVREKIELDGWNRCEKIEQQEQTQQPETLTTPTSNNPAIIIETDGMTNATTLPAARPQTFIQSSTTELLNGQANLSKQMNEQFIQLSQQFSQQLQSLVSLCQGNGLMLGQELDEAAVGDVDVVTQKMNEISQRKTELQAQIDALKLEMDTLAT